MNFKEFIENDRENHNSEKFEGTFLDYLELVRKNPDIVKLAHKRIYDMIIEQGVEVLKPEDNPKIKKYLKLKTKKYRDNFKLYLVETDNLIKEAINNNCLVDLLALDGSIDKYDFNVTYVSKEIIKKLSSLDTTSNFIGIVKMKEMNNNFGNRILILDDIQDPGNLGTIIRSSVAFNITDIILSNNSVDLYNDKVIRSSEGMIYKINIVRTDLIKVVKKLKENNYLILGTNVREGVDVKEVNSSRFALIMGNEGKGVKEEILNLCDKNLYIKMNKNCESLNLGVATGILLYELGEK